MDSNKKIDGDVEETYMEPKSRYNMGDPIDLNELSEEERRVAIHEWADGSASLEQLLNESYENGLLSHACCGGGGGEHCKNPYVEFNLTDEHSQKIAMHLAQQLQESGLDCNISFGSKTDLTAEGRELQQRIGTKSIVEVLNNPDFNRDLHMQTQLTSLNVRTLNENREEVFANMSGSINSADLENIKLPTHREDIPSQNFKPRETEMNTQGQTDNREQTVTRESIDRGNQTGQQMIDGAVEQSQEIGIRADEISGANREINQTQQQIEQPVIDNSMVLGG